MHLLAPDFVDPVADLGLEELDQTAIGANKLLLFLDSGHENNAVQHSSYVIPDRYLLSVSVAQAVRVRR